MSDLFCPASVVLARHGEADDGDGVPLDHQGGSLTPAGREQARRLGESLRDRRIALVYASSMSRAVQTAEIAAGVLGVAVRVRRDLREFGNGGFGLGPDHGEVFAPVIDRRRRGDLAAACPGAESGADVIRRVAGELDRIADEHRGETVLVVSHGGAIRLTLPALVPGIGDCWTAARDLGNAACVELEADADGWRCLSWAARQP